MPLNVFLRPAGTRAQGPRSSPGLVRRFLRALGPTWLASPVRRLAQAFFFVAFLVLFFHVSWPDGSAEYAETLRSKELIEAESFLSLDPLVGLSAAIAARTWVWSMAWAGALVLLCCLVAPRGFCGYVCPLGTLIDLFDRVVGGRPRLRPSARAGWWTNLRYYLLAATLIASVLGVMLAGFVAAIPVLTRAFLYVAAPVQVGFARGWSAVPSVSPAQYLSIGLFALVLGLGVLRPRFWCRHVCPSGAVFSAAHGLRLAERRVDPACVRCGKCADACSFGAVRPDFTTRTANCTFCQTCGGVCPVGAIRFAPRWMREAAAPQSPAADRRAGPGDAGAERAPVSRRGFLAAAGGALAAAVGMTRGFGMLPPAETRPFPVRPPGSVPENEFLRLCVRCGQCMKVCPGNVLQPMGFEAGLERLWTPRVAADWAGCDPRCNKCGQVCPTGAIRALPLEEKEAARMGLAMVDEHTCLPFAGRATCGLCIAECAAAGHHAIEFLRVGVEMDAGGEPIEDSGLLAPAVVAAKCVGCGRCQARCYAANVRRDRSLTEAAIRVVAGPGREDRLMRGSYRALRGAEPGQMQETARPTPEAVDYLPDSLR